MSFSAQICGREALERTTLKSLGLNSGKAILRLIYRDPEQLKIQAHVSTLLLPKSIAAMDNSSSDQNIQKMPLPTPHCSKATDDTTLSMRNLPNTEKQEELKNETRTNVNSNEVKMNTGDETKMNTADETKMDITDETKIDTANEIKMDTKDDAQMDIEDEKITVRSGSQETDASAGERTHSVASGKTDCDTEKSQLIMEEYTRDQEDTYKIEFVRCNNIYVQFRKSDMFAYLTYISYCS